MRISLSGVRPWFFRVSTSSAPEVRVCSAWFSDPCGYEDWIRRSVGSVLTKAVVADEVVEVVVVDELTEAVVSGHSHQ